MSLQNSYVDILTSKILILGGYTFGRLLGQKGGASMNGVNIFIKDTRELASSLSPPGEDTARRHPLANQEEGPHQNSTVTPPEYWTSQIPEL